MFGEVIGNVNAARSPKDIEMALTDAVADPIKPHVHGSAASLFDGVIDDAVGACIVGLNGCGGLRMSHSNEDVA